MTPGKIIQMIQIVGSGDVDIVVLDENGNMWRFKPNEYRKWELLHKHVSKAETTKVQRPSK